MKIVIDWIIENLWLLSGGLIAGIIIFFLMRIMRLRKRNSIAAKAGASSKVKENICLEDQKEKLKEPWEEPKKITSESQIYSGKCWSKRLRTMDSASKRKRKKGVINDNQECPSEDYDYEDYDYNMIFEKPKLTEQNAEKVEFTVFSQKVISPKSSFVLDVTGVQLLKK